LFFVLLADDGQCLDGLMGSVCCPLDSPQGEDDGSTVLSAESYLESREGESPLGCYCVYDSDQNLQYVGYSRNIVRVRVPFTGWSEAFDNGLRVPDWHCLGCGGHMMTVMTTRVMHGVGVATW